MKVSIISSSSSLCVRRRTWPKLTNQSVHRSTPYIHRPWHLPALRLRFLTRWSSCRISEFSGIFDWRFPHVVRTPRAASCYGRYSARYFVRSDLLCDGIGAGLSRSSFPTAGKVGSLGTFPPVELISTGNSYVCVLIRWLNYTINKEITKLCRFCFDKTDQSIEQR